MGSTAVGSAAVGSAEGFRRSTASGRFVTRIIVGVHRPHFFQFFGFFLGYNKSINQFKLFSPIFKTKNATKIQKKKVKGQSSAEVIRPHPGHSSRFRPSQITHKQKRKKFFFTNCGRAKEGGREEREMRMRFRRVRCSGCSRRRTGRGPPASGGGASATWFHFPEFL